MFVVYNLGETISMKSAPRIIFLHVSCFCFGLPRDILKNVGNSKEICERFGTVEKIFNCIQTVGNRVGH